MSSGASSALTDKESTTVPSSSPQTTAVALNTSNRITMATVNQAQRLASAWTADLTLQHTDPLLVEALDTILCYGLEKIIDRISYLHLKDVLGCKFSFPLHLARTWLGMEDFINQAFIQIVDLGPDVVKGHYDLIGRWQLYPAVLLGTQY